MIFLAIADIFPPKISITILIIFVYCFWWGFNIQFNDFIAVLYLEIFFFYAFLYHSTSEEINLKICS